jgi:hypothetical protein
MAKAPTIGTIAAELSVQERVLLFCVVSDTNWVKTGVSHATAQHLLVRNLNVGGPGALGSAGERR